MRTARLFLVLVTGLPAVSPSANALPFPHIEKAPVRVDFAAQVRPILEARCMPCHFQGGKMHEQLPFDQPATIKTLGEKLFSRIKDENEQRLIREFLSQL